MIKLEFYDITPENIEENGKGSNIEINFAKRTERIDINSLRAVYKRWMQEYVQIEVNLRVKDLQFRCALVQKNLSFSMDKVSVSSALLFDRLN